MGSRLFAPTEVLVYYPYPLGFPDILNDSSSYGNLETRQGEPKTDWDY